MPTSTGVRAALFLPALVAAATLTLAGCFQVAPPDDTDTDAEGETVDIFGIAVGDCILETGDSDTVTETTVVDCGEPHASEVFAGSAVADGDFPGGDVIAAQADTDCIAEFESFVGLAYGDSALVVTYFLPTEGSWDAGDREILCLVGDPSGSTTGTLADAGY